MRGHLLTIAGGATVAVGVLAFAATAAYAAPVPTSSSAVAHSLALVVPPNYHPVASAEPPVSPSEKGVVRVAPGAAVDIDNGTNSHVRVPSSPSGMPVDTGSESTGAVPPASSTPPVSNGEGPSGDENASNNGNDVKNKGNGSNKSGSNHGNDVKNKGNGKSNG